MLREQDEQALRADEDLVEEADEAEPDDGCDVDAAERRDELSGDGEEGLRGRVRQHVGDGRMKRKPSADSAGPATPATVLAVAGSRSPASTQAWHRSTGVLLAAATATTVANRPPRARIITVSDERVPGSWN